MSFVPLRCHLQSSSTILIGKDNDPRIVASSVMQICYKSTRETERQALDFAQISCINCYISEDREYSVSSYFPLMKKTTLI